MRLRTKPKKPWPHFLEMFSAMKLAIMQPYFFPYIGYFQLIYAVDIFVAYDDVTYIKGGWINRNYLLMDCKPTRFTVPVADASPFRLINKTQVASITWQAKFLKTLHHAYAKAPQFESVYSLVETVVKCVNVHSLAELALYSLTAVMDYLSISTVVRPTSMIYNNAYLKGQERILDICQREKADTYINLPGGRALYEWVVFFEQGVDLRFLQPGKVHYNQFHCNFVPNLSILDVLMFNERETVRELLKICTMIH